MSILLDNTTRVIVQGITGREGQFHTRNMIAAGTNMVGGVTPGKGGTTAEGLPVFDTVEEAVQATGATCSCILCTTAWRCRCHNGSGKRGYQADCMYYRGYPRC